MQARSEARQIQAEARSTAETADRLANGESPEGADEVRMLSGMVRQLADQIGRLADLLDAHPGSEMTPDAANKESGRGGNAGEVAWEEDLTPEDAPADPARERDLASGA